MDLAGNRVERRLEAILAADVAGYSRLMGADEEGTHARLKALRAALIDPRIAESRGRIVKTTGDGLLVEFASVVDAVHCAAEVQRSIAAEAANADEDRRIEFRIGINLGDVIFDGDDIFGDGVNIAARLEGIADPGGICISDDAYRQVRGKLDIAFEDRGDQRLKNIANPVRVHTPALDGRARPARIETTPHKPSIAVVPFINMSGDPEQDYFADGIVEDIITALSRFRSLFVVSRHSSFAYKGAPSDIKKIGRELGVRYVLQGSVRKAGDRLRVTAQLVEPQTDSHLWAETYNRVVADIFDVQDDIMQSTVGAIEPSIKRAEIERAKRKRPTNLYDLYLRALPGLWSATREGNEEAVAYLKQSLAADSKFAASAAMLGYCYTWGLHTGGGISRNWRQRPTGTAR
jgi:TolB-like protein